jgi:hypothetical protein
MVVPITTYIFLDVAHVVSREVRLLITLSSSP